MIARRSASGRSLGGEPWKQRPWWNAAPPGGTSIGTISASTLGRPHLVHPAEPVLGRVERVARSAAGPRRASRARSRSCPCRPRSRRAPSSTSSCSAARGTARRRRPGAPAAPCPTAASRSCCPAAAACPARRASLAAKRALRSASVMCASQRSAFQTLHSWRVRVGRRHARRVVDLVGREARLPLVLEAGVEALARALDLVVREPALDDQEAVALVRARICSARRLGRRHA